MYLADPYCFLVMDQAIWVILDKFVFDCSIVESSGDYWNKSLLLVLSSHLVRIPLLILGIENEDSLFYEMESDVMLGHLRIDGADVYVWLGHVCLLCGATEHFPFNIHYHLQVLYRNVLLKILFVEHAEIVVSHRHCTAWVNVFHHVTELFLMLDPERLELIDLLLCLFKVVDTILLFFPLHELQTFAIQAHN